MAAADIIAGQDVRDPLVRAERLRSRAEPESERALVLAAGLEDDDPLVRGVAVLSWISEPPEWTAKHLAPGGAWAERLGALPEAKLVMIEHWRRAQRTGRAAPFAAPICEWACAESDPALRSRAAAACALDSRVDEARLRRLAADPGWLVRTRLAAALQERHDFAPASAVLNLLAHDPHPTVRRAALSARPAKN